MLSRLGYLAVTHAFAALRLLPMSDRGKDAEIFALRLKGVNIPIRPLSWAFPVDGKAAGVASGGTR
ncbi:hypothetical protein SSOG_07279 [Streptomyces himastatinicus ATCC 53653]|uniref:Uncharacterized protein n=1 Tax=Streptomyces himastatinicus ATCC 53653 TaxID=457427 RepID=D9WIR2_9ACTN|nr:hypothetical protein [Streptomyces himastatinicus]EFL27565.1 hypothetical protein SSOG_07279 [Streptomyces himastatinicus ATCC 53653]